MDTSAIRKRNRSDNFDVDDIELLLGLVSEHTSQIDSNNFELKKQGWEAITTKYNENCIGIKRDLNALKLKIKNLKAQSKKMKVKMEVRETSTPDPLSENNPEHGDLNGTNGVDNETMDEEYSVENGSNELTEMKPMISIINSITSNDNNNSRIRKRCKKFTVEEQDLLLQLHDKYCGHLDTSSTPNSVKRRNDAWEKLTEEYNHLQQTGVYRECNELKIKIKNIRALRVKTEPSEQERIIQNSQIYSESDTSASKGVIEERQLIIPKPIISLQNQPNASKNYHDIANSTAANDMYYDDDDFEEEFSRSNQKPTAHESAEDKEIEKIRKENILLKNALLRKKERLVELQIALAERNLRRQL